MSVKDYNKCVEELSKFNNSSQVDMDVIFEMIDCYNLTSEEIENIFFCIKSNNFQIIEAIPNKQEIKSNNGKSANLIELISMELVHHEDGITAKQLAKLLKIDKHSLNSILYKYKDVYYELLEGYRWVLICENQEEDSSLEKHFEDVISRIIDEYKVAEAEDSVRSLIKNNKLCRSYYSELLPYIKNKYGKTFEQFCIENGIIKKKEETGNDLGLLKSIANEIVQEFSDKEPVYTVTEIFRILPKYEQYKTQLNSYSRKIFGMTLREFFIKEGIVTTEKTVTIKQDFTELYEIVEKIKIRYQNVEKEVSVTNIFLRNEEFKPYYTLLNSKSKQMFGMPLAKYFEEIGLIQNSNHSERYKMIIRNFYMLTEDERIHLYKEISQIIES